MFVGGPSGSAAAPPTATLSATTAPPPQQELPRNQSENGRRQDQSATMATWGDA